MSYNGSGTFQINTSGQPVVAGTVISSTAFNALTADLATGLSTAITKDGQTTTTARIPFAAGINSSLTTDSTSTSTGSMITAGGVGIAKALYVGTTANVAGAATLGSTLTYGGVTLTNAVTGTGKMVLDTSPTLVTPILGTPASGSLVNCTDINYTGFKNRIINGAMVIDQRNAGASVTPANGDYVLDRFIQIQTVASKYSVQQNAGSVSVLGATGFTNYLGCTSLSAYSIAAGDIFTVSQRIEGYNIADLAYGTASAKTVTISAWVYSSLTGTFGGSLLSFVGGRSYPFTFSIPSANTWTQISVTIPGDTTTALNSTSNGIGLQLNFGLGVGSTGSGTAGAWNSSGSYSATGATSVVGTSGATFYITGVQLEKGSTATSFDYRPYGTELMLCERYALLVGDGLTGQARTTSDTFLCPFFQQPMRATPTVTMTDTSVNISDNFAANFISSGSTASQVDMTAYGGRISISGFTGLTLGRTYTAFSNTNGSVMLLSAEL